ncbi:MAG: ATP-binding protein [Syntrophales bacterium]|nr:ATP-binding protein [Syntrophales bacterium]
MDDHLLQKENLVTRVRWLMLARLTIVTFLLGIAAFIEIKGTESLPQISISFLYVIILLTYLLSLLYLFLLKFIRNLKVNIYIQSLADVMLITGLVYVTGGIRSVYSVFYPLVIIYSVLFLARRGGVITASASSILYGLLMNLEYYGIVNPFSSIVIEEYNFSAGYVFSRIFTHVLSFYIITFLASFVVEQERKTRVVLAERENAFDQLDLLYRSIIESVDAGILTIDLAGNIKSFNRAAEDITGFSFTEVEHKNINQVFPGYSDLEDKWKNRGKQQGSVEKRVEMPVPGKGNGKLILGCSVSHLKDNTGTKIGNILIFQDLTAIKKMEEALEKSKRLAFIGEMAASLAHEIRNPLASISGSIQVLKNELNLNEADERLMKIILRGKGQLENFMRDFLLLARPPSGTYEIIETRNIIEDVLESIHYAPDWHGGIEVVQKLSDQSLILANKTQIRQVIWNLVLNAIQSMSDGGRLTVETKNVFLEDVREYLEIRITDSGCGIEEDNLEKIWEPFYTTKERGTGLGLTIVNRIIESYSGKIKIEGNLKGGTTFIVCLPSGR